MNPDLRRRAPLQGFGDYFTQSPLFSFFETKEHKTFDLFQRAGMSAYESSDISKPCALAHLGERWLIEKTFAKDPEGLEAMASRNAFFATLAWLRLERLLNQLDKGNESKHIERMQKAASASVGSSLAERHELTQEAMRSARAGMLASLPPARSLCQARWGSIDPLEACSARNAALRAFERAGAERLDGAILFFLGRIKEEDALRQTLSGLLALCAMHPHGLSAAQSLCALGARFEDETRLLAASAFSDETSWQGFSRSSQKLLVSSKGPFLIPCLLAHARQGDGMIRSLAIALALGALPDAPLLKDTPKRLSPMAFCARLLAAESMALLFAAGANNPLAPDFTGESPKTRFEKASAHFHMASHPGNGAILLCRNFFAMAESILIEKTLDGDKKRPESPSLRV